MKQFPGGVSRAGGGMRQRTCSSPLLRTPLRSNTGLGEDTEAVSDCEAFHGWVKTWTWTLTGAFIYVTALWIVELCFSADPVAYAQLSQQVPLLVYQMSSTAFFTALVLNLTSLLFEDNAPKRQLALLSCAIKGAACHTDMLFFTGRAIVVYDAFGKIVIPQRYVQWLVTTPTMVFILSKISDFTPQQTATAIGLDMLMVVSGLCANFARSYLNWLLFGVSMFSFVAVLYLMGRMVFSAIKEQTSSTSRRSLLFIYMCTLLIWNLFPLAWILHVVYENPAYGEYLNVFANFMAKVLFSSSIMYGNYMTIAQRRLLVQQAAENAHRLRMIQELRDAVTRKDQFMSLMSHELRTPLNGIIQLSDALVRGAGGEMNPKGQHFVKTIKNSSNHLLNIINDILDVAALKEGKLTIKHELCSLAKAVDHVVDIVAPLAKKDVTIDRSVDPRTPLIIADFSRVIQILYNLTGNALKFTHKGRVSVLVAASQDGTQVLLQVSDTGIGIPADKIDGIWGAFEQVDMSVTRKYGGTGLGLNIVKQLVEAHEGSITVQSVEGRGTTFTVALPVLQANSRQSLEIQVAESLFKCGYDPAKVLGRKRRLSAARPGSGIEEAILQLTKGAVGKSNGIAFNKETSGPDGNVTGGSVHEKKDVLYRRRTQELERENLIGDLQRRTEHKRSMEEAQLASRQLDLSEPERKAERDSRSLERLEDQLAAGSRRSGSFHRNRSGRLGGDAGHGGFTVWRADGGHRGDNTAQPAAPPVSNGTSMSMCTADGDADTACRPLGRSGSITFHPGQGAQAGMDLGGEGCDHLPPTRFSNESSCAGASAGHGSGSSASLLRKLSNASQGSRAAPAAARTAPRLSTFGRIGGGGGGGAAGPFLGGGSQSMSGPIVLASASGGGGQQQSLLKSALESDLYRNSRNSLDETSSIGGDSESDIPRLRRHASKAPHHHHHHGQGHNRSARASMAQRSGSTNGHVTAAPSPAAASGGIPPPPGLTLEKLAYSDMFGCIQVLSVDDEEVNQIVLEEILTSSGYQFARCMDGLEALEWLCAADTMPDLILLDCMMPNMSGHEFCATLRKVIPGNVLPVIMVSAKSDEDNIVEGLRSGSNDFVRKPYQREELLARIETQLRLKSDSWWLAELVNNVDGPETESMKLLKNILPESIIARMQQGQKFVADSHAHVVILFSDIVGFTNLSSKLPSAEVFLMLSNMFTAFDKLTDRFSVYKVETIGDAYMVAAGHDEDDDKVKKGPPLMRVLGFARAMLDVVRNITAPNGERMRIRIGVHCGPAFAGVIGMKCPRYCFLGDTVNTASRMESTGFPMCIHVSENVYRHHTNPDAELQEVGVREVKGKGRMRTYLVRVGAWEQALQDYAARQAAAVSAAVLQQQQQKQLEVAQAWFRKHQQEQQQKQLADSDAAPPEGDSEHVPVATVAIDIPGSGGRGPSGSGRPSATASMAARYRNDLLLLLPADSFDSAPPCWSPVTESVAASQQGGPEELLLPPPQPMSPLVPVIDSRRPEGQQQQLQQEQQQPGECQPDASLAAGARMQGKLSVAAFGGPGDGSGGAGGRPVGYVQSYPTEGASRLMHHLSTVKEESSSSRPVSPVTQSGQGGGPLSPVVHPRVGSGGSVGSGRSPLGCRPDAGSCKLAPRSTFGSEYYYCDDDSEDGGMNGICTITGMLRSPSGSLSGMAGQGGGARAGVASADRAAAQVEASRRGGSAAIAMPGQAGARPQAVVISPGAEYHDLSRTASADRRFLQHLLQSGKALSPNSAGINSGMLPSTVVYLEQRVSSLAAQLAAEAVANQKLQDELDAERRRAVTAMQQATLLEQQLECTRAGPQAYAASPGQAASGLRAGPSGGEPLLVPPHLVRRGSGAGSGLGKYSLEPGGSTNVEADEARSAGGAGGPSSNGNGCGGGGSRGGDEGLPFAGSVMESPFVLSDLERRVAAAAAGARASDHTAGTRRGPRPPSGVQRGPLTAMEVAGPVTADDRTGESTVTTLASFPPSALYSGAARPAAPAVTRRVVGGISLELQLVATAVSGGGGGKCCEASWALPSYSLDQLFADLGLVPYLPRFQEEAIRLDMLLGMDMEQLEKLGLRPLGYCIRLREAVIELARGLLRACEDAALLSVRDLATT